MKTPQRQFVVEFKSGRRRSTMRPDSIWGNTDLKAFARQAETAAPHLFESKIGLEILDQDADTQPDRQSKTQRDDSYDTFSQNQVAASLTEPVQVDSSQNGRDPVSSISRSKKHASKQRSLGAARRTRKTRLENHADGRDERGERSTAAHVEVVIDELVVLDSENRRLKALLAKQLHQQNLRLRTMLERFSVS